MGEEIITVRLTATQQRRLIDLIFGEIENAKAELPDIRPEDKPIIQSYIDDTQALADVLQKNIDGGPAVLSDLTREALDKAASRAKMDEWFDAYDESLTKASVRTLVEGLTEHDIETLTPDETLAVLNALNGF